MGRLGRFAEITEGVVMGGRRRIRIPLTRERASENAISQST